MTELCQRCQGSGRLRIDEPECNGGETSAVCERCNGSGRAMTLPGITDRAQAAPIAGASDSHIFVRCPKCKGKRRVGYSFYSAEYYAQRSAEKCSRCNGAGKLLRKRPKRKEAAP
jgi:DnaJ-class molecular chaperone